MEALSIISVKKNQHWQDFFELPKTLYRQDPVHVPELRLVIEEELNTKKNPVFKFCQHQAFLLKKGKTILGRAVAIINPRMSQAMQQDIGLIGYFECINDDEAAKQLIDQCANWCADQGAQKVLGNINFSLNYQTGLLTEGFNQPHTFLMPHHPSFYGTLFNCAGFGIEKRLFAYKVDLQKNKEIPHSLIERARKLLDEGFIVRSMQQEDLIPCFEDYNSSWNDNYGHTSFTHEELEHLLKMMRLLVDYRFCFVVEKAGKLAGYLFTFPDFNETLHNWQGRLNPVKLLRFGWKYKVRRSVVGLKTAIIGITPDFRGQQLTALLNHALLVNAKLNNCQYIERSWILEDNIASIKQATRMGGKHYKTYTIYGKTIRP